jgi:hypothetical protein
MPGAGSMILKKRPSLGHSSGVICLWVRRGIAIRCLKPAPIYVAELRVAGNPEAGRLQSLGDLVGVQVKDVR